MSGALLTTVLVVVLGYHAKPALVRCTLTPRVSLVSKNGLELIHLLLGALRHNLFRV